MSNWPGRWKVLAIALVPTVVAITFGGMRIYSSATEAADLRVASDRSEMIRPINEYMSALDAVLLAALPGRDLAASLREFDTRRAALQDTAAATDVLPDVQSGIAGMLQDGQALREKVESNSIGVRDRVTGYAPILLASEDAINGSVRVGSESIRLQAAGLSRAVGARGQMVMQELLVDIGGGLPEPELRTSMITLAGTEPSTLFGMSQVLGVGSPDAATLREQMVNRLAIMSDPASVLADNPELRQSIQTTDKIANKVVDDTVASITSAVGAAATAQRTAAIRDSVIVLAAIALAVVIGFLMAVALVRPLRVLRDSALRIAHQDLDKEIAAIRAGGEPGPVEPIAVFTSDEVGQVAHAVDELHEQALLLAGEQARLQMQVDDMFKTLSRRSRSLVDQQLLLIDQLERDEEDPERLDRLFRLDHLAARMRRNGANLLVLSGARVPREQSDPVAMSAVINAAASEVEDYPRVVTSMVPDTWIVGSAAGDVVHLLAELMDNALRYSDPSSQVEVSVGYTANGGLAVEVGDRGLGMTGSDLRVANTRLESGGEVTPYTARHMGLFVVGRLAQQHGLVVRLRSAVHGEPGSGMVASVYVPAGMIAPVPAVAPSGSNGFESAGPPDSPSGMTRAAAPEEVPAETFHYDQKPSGEPHVNGSSRSDLPISLLPQRNPGASGIAEIPPSLAVPTADEEASRAQAADESGASRDMIRPEPVVLQPVTEIELPVHAADSSDPEDAIYQKMLSEWLIDPTELASSDREWDSVWDSGWSAAADAAQVPVHAHTDSGLPVREPGARLVPGGAHRQRSGDDEVTPESGFDTGPVLIPPRDPDAVRAAMSSHFGGVRAGRSHAREPYGTDNK